MIPPDRGREKRPGQNSAIAVVSLCQLNTVRRPRLRCRAYYVTEFSSRPGFYDGKHDAHRSVAASSSLREPGLI